VPLGAIENLTPVKAMPDEEATKLPTNLPKIRTFGASSRCGWSQILNQDFLVPSAGLLPRSQGLPNNGARSSPAAAAAVCRATLMHAAY
jgi:hypothetical protein